MDARGPRRGLDLLRRHRLAGDPGRDLDNADWLGAWAPGGASGSWPTTSASRSPSRHPDRHAGALQPARGRRRRPQQPCGCACRRQGRRRCRRCSCPPRSSCPAGAGHDGRCATATLRSPTCKQRFGEDAGHRRPAPPALRPASSRARCRRCTRTVHERGDHPRASPATCTCSAARSRSTSTRARRAPSASSTSRVWNFDDQGVPLDKPVRLEPGDTRHGDLHPRPGLRDLLPAFDGTAGPLRRLGRGHDRRDVPRDRPDDRAVTTEGARCRPRARGVRAPSCIQSWTSCVSTR